MMKVKKLFVTSVIVTACIISANSMAKSSGHCPAVEEITVFDTRTTVEDKSVHWKMLNRKNLNDEIDKFDYAILKRKSGNTFDMDIYCQYITKQNQKITLKPLASWQFYVDGVAKKPLGNYWTQIHGDTLACRKSLEECGFVLR